MYDSSIDSTKFNNLIQALLKASDDPRFVRNVENDADFTNKSAPKFKF